MAAPPEPRLLFLRQSSEIERVKKLGRRRQAAVFTMLMYRSGTPDVRIAIIVGKRFGTAVKRNRVKRIFRELARHARERLLPGHDLVIFPRRDALTMRHAELTAAWQATLGQAGLLRAETTAGCNKPSSS